MKIANIDGLTPAQIRQEINNGGSFVYFPYTISIVLMTFKRASDVHLVKAGESKFKYHIPYTMMNLLLGWWGIPWGPIYTIGSLSSCLGGGKDVTNEIMSHINQSDPNYGTQSAYNIPGQPASNSSSSGYNIPGANDGTSAYNIPK